jgi:hypothetical protein
MSVVSRAKHQQPLTESRCVHKRPAQCKNEKEARSLDGSLLHRSTETATSTTAQTGENQRRLQETHAVAELLSVTALMCP